MNQIFSVACLLFFLFISGAACSQNNEMKIRFIGNCGLYLTDGKDHVYIDFPYKSGAHNYMEYNLSELDSVKMNPVFIYTHKHGDHYSGKLVKRLANKLDGHVYGPWNVDELSELDKRLQNFTIEPLQSKHRFSFNHYSYLITWHQKHIFISGDTEHPETIASIAHIDWAFVPAWLISYAYEQNIKLSGIENIVVYHIGPRDKITTSNPKIKLLNTQGEIITVAY